MNIEPKVISYKAPWQNGVNDRCHLTLDRNSPKGRAVQHKPSEAAKVIPIPRFGGLQHKYEWKEAA